MTLWARLSKYAFVPVLVYCAILARPALRAHFSNDDPMNMGWAWRDGFWYLLWHNITFWTTAYRPMGQLYYLSIYRIFGLNPVPYRFVILCIVVSNAYLSYRLAELLTGSRTIAFLTALFACAHAQMVDMYYQNDIIYDVLAYFFTMLTLIRYVSIRKQGRLPSLRESIVIVCLFIAALNSKEMSATLAGFILAYEVLFHWPSRSSGSVMAWVKREGRVPLILVLMTGIYTAGKILGPDSLSQDDAYKLHFSAARYLERNVYHLNNLFYMFRIFNRQILIATDVVLLAGLLFFKKSPVLRWCCFYSLTAPLPISFVQVQRGGTSLYLALFGWALLLSVVLVKLIEIISPTLDWTLFQIPSAAIRVALVIGLAYGYVSETVREWRGVPRAMMADQAQTWSIFSQLQKLPFRPPPRSSVLFLDDPFKDYRIQFIAQLVWDDHAVNIDLANEHTVRLTPAEMAGFDHWLTVEDGQVKLVPR